MILSSTYMVSGNILTEDPEATFTAQLFQNGEAVSEPVDSVTTVTEGYRGPVTTISYEIDGALPGEGYCVEIRGGNGIARRTPEFKIMSTNVLQKNLEIALAEAGAEVTGTVTDASGAPLPGVKICAKEGLGYGFGETDEAGAFAVVLPKDASYTLVFDGGEGLTAEQEVDLTAAPEALEVTLGAK